MAQVPKALWFLVGVGTAVRLAIAFSTFGNPVDIQGTGTVVGELVDGDPFDAYGSLRSDPMPVWPYLPGFLPVAVLSAGMARLLPGEFHGWVHVGPVLADGVLALVVARALGRRGLNTATQLAGGAMVAVGPLFAIVSGYAFQIDAVAVIPALLAVLAWDPGEMQGRARRAGLLIGLAATIKSPLGLVVLTLLPTARCRREAGAVVGWAVLVPLVALAPFLIADAGGTVAQVLGHTGLAGQAMLGAVVQPGLTEMWVTRLGFAEYRSVLEPLAPLLLAAIVAGVLATGLRFRPPALVLSIVLWLAVWAFGAGFFFHYLLWGIPFLLVADRLLEAAVLQAMGFVGILVLAVGSRDPAVLTAYRILVYVLLAVTVVLLVASIARLRLTSPANTGRHAPQRTG